MANAQQGCEELYSALAGAGFDCRRSGEYEGMAPGMSMFEVKLGIPGAEPTLNGGDTLIQFSDEYGAKITTRLFEVPDDESKAIQCLVACNALNAAQGYVKYYVAPENSIIYVDHDFVFSDGGFCQRIESYLPKYTKDVSSAISFLKAASELQ